MYNLNKNDMCNAAFVLYLQNMVCMVRLRQRKCQRRYHQPPSILSPCTITRQNKVEHSASEQYLHFCSKRLQIKLMCVPPFPFYPPPPPHLCCCNSSLKACSSTKWDYWNMFCVAQLGNLADLIHTCREHNCIGREAGVVGLVPPMVLLHCTGGGDVICPYNVLK